MKRCLFIFLTVFLLTGCVYSHKLFQKDIATSQHIEDPLVASGKKIDRFYDVDINGCQQKILVQSNDIINNPILLYLHGGPGSSALIFSHLYSEKLKDNFIFVNWDQRGTAFSYHEGMDTAKISEDQIRDDALELIKYLLKTFHKNKIYLVSHSFGSVLGIRLAANNPEYFYAYIGVGQVIDYDKSVAITYKWLHDTLEKANDIEGLKRIEAHQFPYIDLVAKYGGRHRLSLDLDFLKTTSPYYYEGYLELAEKGRAFSQKYVEKNQNSNTTSAKSISEMKVPLYFFEGINDHVIACAPELVVEYCQKVKAPKKKIIWFYDSAHHMNIEEPVKFQNELIKILKETNWFTSEKS